MKITTIAAAGAILALGACSGGAGTVTPRATPTPPPTTVTPTPTITTPAPPPTGDLCTHTWPSDNGRCGTYDEHSGITLPPTASGPWVDQNVWSRNTAYHQVMHAASPADWYVTVNVNTNFGGVKAYPNTGWGMAWPEVALDTYHALATSWAVSIPADTTKVAGWAAYDLWFNNWADEVMIQTDITANSYYDCTAAATATFDGQPWHLCVFGSEKVWKPGTDDQHLRNETSGSLNVQPFLTWMEANGYLPAHSKWTGGSFGFEIADTHGTDQVFRVSAFTWQVS